MTSKTLFAGYWVDGGQAKCLPQAAQSEPEATIA